MKNFTQIPNIVFRTPSLSIHAKVVLGYLFTFGNKCYPSYKAISDACNISRPTVAKAIKELKDRNILTYLKGSGTRGVANSYAINKESDWNLVKEVNQLITLTSKGDCLVNDVYQSNVEDGQNQTETVQNNEDLVNYVNCPSKRGLLPLVKDVNSINTHVINNHNTSTILVESVTLTSNDVALPEPSVTTNLPSLAHASMALELQPEEETSASDDSADDSPKETSKKVALKKVSYTAIDKSVKHPQLIVGKSRSCRHCGFRYIQPSGYLGACSKKCYDERRGRPTSLSDSELTTLNSLGIDKAHDRLVSEGWNNTQANRFERDGYRPLRVVGFGARKWFSIA